MNCVEIRPRLEDYADDLLPVAERAGVDGHLAGCESCRLMLEEMRKLGELTAALPRDIRPPRDLWAGIEAVIAPAERPDRHRLAERRWWERDYARLAAAAILLIALSSGLTALIMRQLDSGGDRFTKVQAEYTAASTDLTRRISSGPGALSPRTLAIVQRNLQIIDAAIREAEQALARDPGNAGLERMLWTRYQQRIDLLERATRTQESS
jgi:hypothetical protein